MSSTTQTLNVQTMATKFSLQTQTANATQQCTSPIFSPSSLVPSAPLQPALGSTTSNVVVQTATSTATPKASAFCWGSLSDDQRRDCAGEKWTHKRCGQFAWDIKGRLRDLYDTQIAPIIAKAKRRKHSKLYGHLQCADSISQSPCLLGPSEDDVTQALPFVYIICADSKKGKLAHKIIERDREFKENRIGFRVAYEKHNIINAARSTPFSKDQLSTIDSFDSLCGSRIFISNIPNSKASDWRTATLGGLIYIDNTYFALTAFHCLLSVYDINIATQNTSAAENSGSGTGDEYESDETEIDEDDENDNFHSLRSNISSSAEDLTPLTSWVYQDMSTLASKPPALPRLIGRFEYEPSHARNSMSYRLVSPVYDYALVPVQDPLLKKSNTVSLREKKALEVVHVSMNNRMPPERVTLAAGFSGVRDVKISGTLSSLTFPWSRREVHVLTIASSVEKGDSGAWVVDDDGFLYGIVIATIPSLEISYIVRAEDVLRNAFPALDSCESLDFLLPQKDNPSPSLAKNSSLTGMSTDIHQWNSDVVQIDSVSSLGYHDQKESSSVLASSANDSGYYSQQSFDALSDVRAHEQVLLDHATLLQSETRLSPAMLKFVQTTRDRFEACLDLLQREKELTNCYPNVLLAEALRAYRQRRIEFAQACVEKFVILTACRRKDEADPTLSVISFLQRLDEDDESSCDLHDQLLSSNWDLVQSLGNPLQRPMVSDKSNFSQSDKGTWKGEQVPSKLRREIRSVAAHRTNVPESIYRPPSPRNLQESSQPRSSMIDAGSPNVWKDNGRGPKADTTIPGPNQRVASLTSRQYDDDQPEATSNSSFQHQGQNHHYGAIPSDNLPLIHGIPKSIAHPPSDLKISPATKSFAFGVGSDVMQQPLDVLPQGSKQTNHYSLDKDYYKRDKPRDYFIVGRVFAIVWHENTGSSGSDSSSSSSFMQTRGIFNEIIYESIRRMVVIRPMEGAAWCCPITTYSGRGVDKPGLSTDSIRHHTIIHMVGQTPARKESETGMTKSPIAVDPARPREKLDPMSRLNFGKIYTVEHNVKVKSVGTVARTSMENFETYISNVLQG